MFQVYETYLCWNAKSGSDSKSSMFTLAPNFFTSGCFLHINQPIWEKKNPRLALCGSAFVSVNLWWTRWSRTHSITLFWKAMVWNTTRRSFNFRFALYDPWAHSRCAPAVMPSPVQRPIKAANLYREKLISEFRARKKWSYRNQASCSTERCYNIESERSEDI